MHLRLSSPRGKLMKWMMFLSKAGLSGEGGDLRARVAQVEAGR